MDEVLSMGHGSHLPVTLTPALEVKGSRKRRVDSSVSFGVEAAISGCAKVAGTRAGAVHSSSPEVVYAGAGVSIGDGINGGDNSGGGGGSNVAAYHASSSQLSRRTLPELGGEHNQPHHHRHHKNRRIVSSSNHKNQSQSPVRPPVKMSDQKQEELDYYIMFPSFPAATTTANNSSSNPVNDDQPNIIAEPDQREEFVFVYEEDKRPVIVLLGWAGCQDKYLAKYSAIYEEKSCITLRYTAPVECLFWRTDRMPHIGKKLVQVIAERRLDEHPIFFHVFSNGGAFLYQHVSSAMEQASNPIKVKGVIFDSAPGERRIAALFKAISAILGGHPMTNIPVSFFITVFLCMLWFYEVIAHAWFNGYIVTTNPFALVEEVHSWPQLFLYSNGDTLIPAMDVEKFASRRAERGVRVQLVLFTGSPHVKHYAMYRDVYVNTVCTFIHECLTTKSLDTSRAMIGSRSNSLESSKSRLLGDEASTFHETAHGLMKRVVLPHEAS